MELKDPWDPNNWDLSLPERRIYLDDHASLWAVVDEEDYYWALRWRWHANKPHAKRNGKKLYAVRNPGWGGNYKPKIYLHVEIMLRLGEPQPSPEYCLVDHINGDELDCRRCNLRWATHSMNNKNSRRIKRGGLPRSAEEAAQAEQGGACSGSAASAAAGGNG